jgi:peptidoglycan/LPS O-acetylase OafA/YrhL
LAVLATAQRERAGVTKDSVAWRTVTELAGFSYSLYVVHLPICLWIRAMFATKSGGVERAQPEPGALASYAVSLGVALAGAWAFARATEARTPTLRAWLYRTLRAA